MMTSLLSILLAAFLACQDPIETNLKLLSDKDPAVREAATVELTKSPLDKLGLIEKRLNDPDADVAARARRVMTHVLKSNLGLRRPRLEFRSMAPPAVMKSWVETGADPKSPPKGYELVRYSDKARKAAGYEQDWVPVEAARITSEDVSNAVPEPEMEARNRPSWNVSLTLTEAGARAFDLVAEELFKKQPKGLLAIMFDERIISAPVVNAPRFGGRLLIQGTFSEDEARELTVILKTDRASSFIRLESEKEQGATPEKTLETIRGIRGFERVTLKQEGTGLEIAGFLTAAEVDVILFWQTLRNHGYRLSARK